ncbi:flagellar biosynthetic protein FliO [Mesorhizobium sp. CAU 1741]|uniref:flagellar biosynthetic protein FliO n=1 Tax=Mesorhizobium sp. CAU 1741 TaxID=3140366 RepID=UPI00325B82B8
MTAWLESIAGPEYANALMWTIFALIGLLVLLVIIRIVRGLTFGTFVAGGKNRKARLAVMDATAVDSHRRLVLVRRDDIEHLILIGGPTDVVVEQNIRLLPPARRTVPEDHEASHAPVQPPQSTAPTPIPAQPAAAPRPAPRPVQPAPRPQYAPPLQPAAPQQPAPRPAPQAPHVSPAPAPQVSANEPRFSSISASSASAPTSPAPVAAATEPAVPVRTLRPVAPVSPAVVAPTQSFATSAPHGSASAQTPPSGEPVDSTPTTARPNLDEELLQELQVTLDIDEERAPADRKDSRESSLDEEMSKLLGELSVQKS